MESSYYLQPPRSTL